MPSPSPVTIMESIAPEPGSWSVRQMASGEPGVPLRFTWRGRLYEVTRILATRRELEPSPEGRVKERYVKRHVVQVLVSSGEHMWLSGSRGTGARAPRWVLRQLLAPLDPGPSPPRA